MHRGFSIVALVQAALVVYCVVGIGIQLKLRAPQYDPPIPGWDIEEIFAFPRAVRDYGILLLLVPLGWFIGVQRIDRSDSADISEGALLWSGGIVCLALLLLALVATRKVWCIASLVPYHAI